MAVRCGARLASAPIWVKRAVSGGGVAGRARLPGQTEVTVRTRRTGRGRRRSELLCNGWSGSDRRPMFNTARCEEIELAAGAPVHRLYDGCPLAAVRDRS